VLDPGSEDRQPLHACYAGHLRLRHLWEQPVSAIQ
jgi:hypothetical protein